MLLLSAFIIILYSAVLIIQYQCVGCKENRNIVVIAVSVGVLALIMLGFSLLGPAEMVVLIVINHIVNIYAMIRLMQTRTKTK